MAFKRASWHSGLTYVQTCRNCGTQVTYMDDKLDFRPWYADGFVYCPTCRTPLRHNEDFAINKPTGPVAVDMTAPVQPIVTPKQEGVSGFCSHCGRAFGENENFCPICGTKR